MYTARFFEKCKKVFFFFKLGNSVVNLRKNSLHSGLMATMNKSLMLESGFFFKEVSIPGSTHYTEWRKNHLTLVISEHKRPST